MAPEPKTIVGQWRTVEGFFHTFDEDGAWAVLDTLVGAAHARGSYSLDGDRLTVITEAAYSMDCVTDDDGNEVCSEETGIYEIVLSEDGDSLSFERIEDDSHYRSRDFRTGLARHSTD